MTTISDGQYSFIIIAVNSCVNILFALCGIYTFKNEYTRFTENRRIEGKNQTQSIIRI